MSSDNRGPIVNLTQYSCHARQRWTRKAMTRYQRDVQIKMWGTGLNRISGLCFGAAIFGAFGIRFVDHQVKIGLIAGALLFFAGMHVVGYLSPPEESENAN